MPHCLLKIKSGLTGLRTMSTLVRQPHCSRDEFSLISGNHAYSVPVPLSEVWMHAHPANVDMGDKKVSKMDIDVILDDSPSSFYGTSVPVETYFRPMSMDTRL